MKKIKFIYISIDNDHEKWKETLNKLDLSGYQFISPANNNNGAGNYFQISSIPRYIIIDKNGNALAGFTALTKPSSKKFINEIEKALSL